jgi:type I restriction enzyme, S subunit
MQNKSIEELCIKITDGSHQSPKGAKSGYPMYSVKDMREFGFSDKDCKLISQEDYQKLKNNGCEPNTDDILIAKDGSVLKHIFRLRGKNECAILSSIAILRPNTTLIDPDYLCFAIKNPILKNHILRNYVSGSGVPRIVLKDFKKIVLPVPELSTQKAIAHILGTLDDKIELNQKMNQTLEEIAKAIFKSWFVDFDPVRAKAEGRSTGIPSEISDLFPDELVESEIGEIPKGWEVVPFTETFEFFSGGTPKTSVEGYWGGDVPWFSIADLNASSPWVTETEKSITELGLSKCSAKLIESGTTIVTARGTVGKVALAGQDMAINQSCYAMAPATGYPNSWLYLQTLALVERLRANAHGSVFDTITRKTFEQFSVLSAPTEVLNTFGEMTSPLFERMRTADLESKILSELRDTLLPNLISGELCIPDAEKFLKEAGI